jgi:hypothetical protein
MNNLIINPQFIGSQQTHRKTRLHRIEIHGDHGQHCIEDQRERRSHLATSYGPVGLWWTAHTSSKGQQGWCRRPPWSFPPPADRRKRPPDGITEEQRLAVAKKFFRVALCWFHNIWEFIEVELGQTEPWGAHKATGRGAPWARRVALPSPRTSSGFLPKLLGSLMSRKNLQKVS